MRNFSAFEKCPCKITNIRFNNKSEVNSIFELDEVKNVIDDATKRIQNHGSVIVRKSGTEPVLKIRVEGEDEALVFDVSSQIVDTIEKLKEV